MFEAPAVILATGGVGKAYKVTSNSWEYTGDGHALALWAGADLIDMEFVQFHPTGMVWPPSVRGILVTEGVRGDGGVLRNAEGERFMFRYIPEMFRAETAETEEEADRWYDDKTVRRTPDLLPRDEVARAINAEIKEGRGSPHGGVYLDIASRRDTEYITRRLPGMYHQFRELADVDITKEPMEVGPTCHYMMGGVRVDAETQASTVPGLYAAGEVAAGLHGANRLGGNSLSDLLVFGRRAGLHAAEYASSAAGGPRVERGRARRSSPTRALRPFDAAGTENPYTIQRDLQECMQALVGIIRTDDELAKALEELVVAAASGRHGSGSRDTGSTTPAGTSRSTSTRCSPSPSASPPRPASARRAAAPRPGRTIRGPTPSSATVNIVVRQRNGELALAREPLPPIPDDLAALLKEG